MKRIALLLIMTAFAASAEQMDASRANGIAGITTSGSKEVYKSTSGQITITQTAGENEELQLVSVAIGGESCLISTATSTECIDDANGHEVVGFYVASTTSGTIRFYDDDDGTCSTNDRSGVITPAVGWHFFPQKFANAVCVLTANTIVVNVVYR